MVLHLYDDFNKKINSTKTPTESDHRVYPTINLLNSTSIMNPVIELKGPLLVFPTIGREDLRNFHYAKITDNEYVPVPGVENYTNMRPYYYYINDITIESGYNVKLSLTLDVLATFKSEIGNLTTMVSRSSHSYRPELKDSFYAPQLGYHRYDAVDMDAFPGYDSASWKGCYVVRTIGLTVHEYGYVMTFSQYKQFLEFASGLDEAAGTDKLRYISSVRWFPFNVATLSSGSADSLFLGPYEMQGPFNIAINVVESDRLTLTGPIAGASYYGDFRDRDPDFTIFQLYVLGNLIEIDPTWLGQTLTYDYVIDSLSGEMHWRLLSGNSIITQFNKYIGFDVPIEHAQGPDVVEAGVSLVSGIISSAIAIDFSHIGNASKDLVHAVRFPEPISQGSYGSRSEYLRWSNIETHIKRRSSNNVNKSINGGFLNETVKLNTIPGYILCTDASISLNAGSDIINEINGYLNGGFYYE